MLAAAHHAWTASGVPVVGVALAARAAEELQAGSGIPATTLTRLLTRLDREPLARGSVVVVDEAGMVGTRVLANLVRHATTADATVVLVGDPMQLPEIHAGGAFVRLAARPDTIRLTENRRQRDPVERQAVAALRAGNAERALDLLDGHGRVHRAATLDAAIAAMARTAGGRLARGQDVLMVAARRWHVDALNAATRARLQRHHRLGQQGGYTAITRGRDTNDIYTVRERRLTLDPDALRETLERDQRTSLARDQPGMSW